MDEKCKMQTPLVENMENVWQTGAAATELSSITLSQKKYFCKNPLIFS